MKGTTHTAVGVASTAIVVSQVFPEFSYIGMGYALVLGYVGSLLPDLDHPKARAHRLAGPFQFLTRWLSRKKVFGKHRTLTHSIVGSIPILAVSWYLITTVNSNVYVEYLCGLIGVVGLYSNVKHVLLRAGVNFLKPFNKATLHNPRRLVQSTLGSLPILIVSWYIISRLGVYPYVDYIGWGLMVGWFSHLLTDTLTVEGVRFLWPFNKTPFGLRMCASGGFMDETFLPLVMPVVTLLFVFQRLLPSGGLLSFIKSLI
jgi:membrane-bound metal-dependent hydrolase YbcI (DUF457 family)